MKHLRNLGPAAFALTALTLLAGAGAASATTIQVGGVTQNKAVELNLSLASGTTLSLKDSGGTMTDTCTGSEVKEKTEGTFTGETISGAASGLTYSGCSHTTHVLKAGRTHWRWIPFTNNGTVFSTETEVTVVSTVFGASATCKTGAGTHIGILTGVFFGRATMHYNAKINCGILGTSTVTGTYTVTSPEGLSFTS
jgi:hypothetical protein